MMTLATKNQSSWVQVEGPLSHWWVVLRQNIAVIKRLGSGIRLTKA